MSTLDVNLTAIFERDGIRKIERYKALGKFSVTLRDGRIGIAETVGDALEAALQPNAENVGRLA
jgi:hypothetical protein